MKFSLCVFVVGLLLAVPVKAEQQGFQDALLDHLVGNWILSGTIAGEETTHDIVVEWVLAHQYIRIHEVAREKDDEGAPAYEAIVFIGWDEPTNRYTCLWLDITGGGGLSADAVGYAVPAEDKLPFVFGTGESGAIHNTFTYDRETDTWRWLIDNERNGERSVFARVTLTRQ
jgi:hypothetical protein